MAPEAPIASFSLTRLAGAGLALVCIAGCAGFPGEPAPTLPEAVLPVVSAQSAIDRVWPGFWPDDQAFLVYEPEGDALLYSPVAPPGGYTPYRVAAPGGADSGRERLYWHEGVPDGLFGIFDTAYPVGENTATAVVLRSTLGSTLETLFHETFHVYQSRHFDDESVGLGFFYVAPETITPSIVAKAEVERLILKEALQVGDRARLRDLARQYLAVRASRTSEMPERARNIERSVERSEGSAQLVGTQATVAALGGDPEAVSVQVAPYLTIPLSDFGGGLPERMFRWRLYGTGAAIGLLLDRIGLASWRERLEDGASFEALLAEAVDFDAVAGPESIAERALHRFDYVSLLRQARAGEGADRGPSFNAPARVVVTFSGPPGSVRGSFSGTFSALEEKLVVIDADLYTAKVADFVLVARNVDVLSDRRNELRLSFAVPALPVIEGVSEGNSTATLQRLNIESGTLTINADRPVEVTAAPASLLIRVLARD